MSEDTNVQYLDQKPYAAKYDRQFFRDILTEGIVKTDDLKVTELDTPGMGVKVAKGRAMVQGDQSEWQGHYGIKNDASKNLTIAASDPTNPRKDRVVAQIYDSVDIGGELDKWALEVLTGTPATSPVPPALPDDALDLAIVDVGAGVTEILNANITDQRAKMNLQNVIDSFVQIVGNQSIAGVKTFDEGAIVGAPKTYTPSAAGTATLNLSLGNEHRITMPAGNITIAISDEKDGQKFIISILQDGTGSRTVTWFSTIKWAEGSAPTLTTTPNKRDTFGFIVTGMGTYDGFIIGQNI